MKYNPKVTSTELTDNLGISRRTLARTIFDLKEQGLIVRQGGNKRGLWMVK
jgi:predicted HTH transcriptional regulator